MAINRIEKLDKIAQTQAVQPGQEAQTGRAQRLELNTQTTFERGSDSDFDPANFQGTFTDDQRRDAANRFSALSIDDQAAVDLQVDKFHAAVSGVSAGTASIDDATQQFHTTLQSYNSALYGVSGLPSSSGVHRGNGTLSEVTDILIRSMGRVEDDTQAFAMDLKDKLNMKADLRTQATELADMVSHWPDGVDKQHFQWTSYDVDSNTGKVTTTQHQGDLTKDEALDLQKNLQAQLDTLSDITQSQQLDLQNKYQMQQQTMSVMSEIMKNSHDTMKNTIMNTKAS